MHLAWAQYQSGPKSQYHLILPLVEHEDRYSVLLCSDILTNEIELIRKNVSQIESMEIADKIAWFRSNIANYNKAYREFKKDRLHIEKTFPLKSLV